MSVSSVTDPFALLGVVADCGLYVARGWKLWSMRTSVLTSMQPLELVSGQPATLAFVPAKAHACVLLLAVLTAELVTVLASIRPSMRGGHSLRYRGGRRVCRRSL